MAIRDDMIFNWELSPRIIMVEAPSTELTVQDLVDTCRAEEDELLSMDNDHIINAAGKEDLGGGVTVGITATFQDAKVAFQARNTSVSNGTVTTPNSGVKLIDSSATFITDGIKGGDTIVNFTDQSITTVITVDSEIQITHEQLTDGIENDWDMSDFYKIFAVESCELSGGNLTALDSNDLSMSAIHPTAFTQIVKTSSSSATLMELENIQHSSFSGGITLDIINGISGTEFPTGTSLQPVGNLADAKLIAIARGFETLFIVGNITFSASDNIDGYIIEGQTIVKSTITLQTGVSTLGCEFKEATINGVLDGSSQISECTIQDLTYIEGTIKDCILVGTITLSGGTTTNIIDCHDGLPGDQFPVIDFGGSGQSLVISEYSGDLILDNKTGTEKANIDLGSGRITINNTVNNGDLIVGGIGTIIDNSTGSTTVNSTALISQQMISDITIDIQTLKKMIENDTVLTANILTIYDDDKVTPWRLYDLSDGGRIIQ